MLSLPRTPADIERAIEDAQREAGDVREEITEGGTLATRKEAKAYDPETGTAIFAYEGQAQKGLAEELNAVARQLSLARGPGGPAALERGLSKAVAERKAQLRREYVTREAERLRQVAYVQPWNEVRWLRLHSFA